MAVLRDISDLLPEVMIFAPSVPEPIALRFIRDAARELCERTRVWKERDSFTVSTPGEDYLCTFVDTEIIAFENPRLDGYLLEAVTPDQLDELMGDWEGREGPARYVTQFRPNTFTVAPRQAGSLSTRLTLMPAKSAQQLPDFLIDTHGTTIGKGAAGRILALPNVEYANPQLGAAYINEFKTLLDELAVSVRKGQQRARLGTKPRFF